MAKGRGVVLEVRNHQAVVLDETGLFRHVSAEGHQWQVGDEIWIDVEALAPAGRAATARSGRPWWRTRGWAVAAACALLVALAVPLAYQADVSAQTVAVVTLDVNPSVELDLNASARVVRAVGLDPGGQRLLAHVRVNGAPLATAMTQITDQAAAEGFVSKTATVPIVIAAAPARASASLPAAVTTALQAGERSSQASMTKAGYHVQVAAVSAPSSDQQSARALHLSLGRYLIYQAAKSAGLAVKPADLRGGTIVDGLRRAGASSAAVQQVLQGLARLDVRGGATAKGAGTGGTQGRGKGHGEAATTVRGGSQQGQGQSGGQRRGTGQGGDHGQSAGQGQGSGEGQGARQGTGAGQGQSTGSGQRSGQDQGSGQGQRVGQGQGSGGGPNPAATETAQPGSDQGQGAGRSGRNQGGGNQQGRRGQGASVATATASPSGQRGDGSQGQQGRAQAPVGWPERLWQDLQGFLHGNRHRQQQGDHSAGSRVGGGAATPSASAADRQRGQGSAQAAGQAGSQTACATASATAGNAADRRRQGDHGGQAGAGANGSGGTGNACAQGQSQQQGQSQRQGQSQQQGQSDGQSGGQSRGH